VKGYVTMFAALGLSPACQTNSVKETEPLGFGDADTDSDTDSDTDADSDADTDVDPQEEIYDDCANECVEETAFHASRGTLFQQEWTSGSRGGPSSV